MGHAWGGALAWLFAHRYPALTASVSSLNAPHPAAYRRVLAHSWRQRLMSWYILYFQIPWLPEFTLRLGLEPLRRPALIVWGEQDPYLLRENAAATREWAPDLRLHYIADAGHWVQCERPDLVNRYLIEFLRDRTAEEAPAPIEK